MHHYDSRKGKTKKIHFQIVMSELSVINLAKQPFTKKCFSLKLIKIVNKRTNHKFQRLKISIIWLTILNGKTHCCYVFDQTLGAVHLNIGRNFSKTPLKHRISMNFTVNNEISLKKGKLFTQLKIDSQMLAETLWEYKHTIDILCVKLKKILR